MIEATNIRKVFSVNTTKLEVLKNIDLEIKQGEFVAICGKSGSGKTTLLNILSGLDRPSSGRVLYDNVDINALNGKKSAEFRNKKLGFIFQKFFLEPDYTVYANLRLPILLSKEKDPESELIDELLEFAGLSAKKAVKTKLLSGGEQQRLCIARALVNKPEYIFADEPCGNLDSENSSTVMKMLTEMNGKGKTVILVTHDEEFAKHADRIITLKDGTILR